MYYLSIDIGASSGRHILGHLENGKLVTQEIYRFDNGAKEISGSLCWDIESLYKSVLAGLKRSAEMGYIPDMIGIDTWGVDYVLLDGTDNLIGEAVCYRDLRTTGAREETEKFVSKSELFEKTGIQPQQFNTIFQLFVDKERQKRAKTMLFIPEYLTFLLTGAKKCEYTIASTSGLINAVTKEWDCGIINSLGINPALFGEVNMPGSVTLELCDSVIREVGYTAQLALAPMHDTASAVLAVPSNDKTIFLSSGTWSLIGTEIETPILTEEALNAGFTNEGGYDGRYRFLKNIMGLWMIQSVRNEQEEKISFDELCEMAKKSDFTGTVEVNDDSFLSPKSMSEAVIKYFENRGEKVPKTLGDMVKCIYESLAKSYKEAVSEIEKLTGTSFDNINIVGGGSKDEYLNELTRKYTGKNVITGPSEATAIGNILSQMLQSGEIADIKTARNIVKDGI